MDITIRDVAEKSGFSRSTVSRALSNPPMRIKEKTRKRILEVAREFGYVKNFNAQALGVGKANDIGLIVPALFESHFHRDLYQRLTASILYHSNELGYGFRLILAKDEGRFSNILGKMYSYRLSGLIISPDWWQAFYENMEILKKIDLPVVLFNNPIKGDKIHSVVLDDFQGGYDGTKYLINLGHKRIAIFRGVPQDMEDRYEGYKQAMEDNGLKIDKDLILRNVPDERVAGIENTKKVLNGKVKPTAIFCLGDDMAVASLRTLQAMGYDCPRDISVLGYDGIEAGEFTTPGLTTMARPIEKMAEEAVELLLKKDKNETTEHIIVKAKLLERGSCGKPKKDLWENENI